MQAVATRTRALSPWPLFGLVVAACWWGVLRLHSSAGHHHGASFAVLVMMWALMTLAMMAPTAVPVLATLRTVLHREGTRRWWLFLGGYLAVWLAFAAAAAALQRTLMSLDLVAPDGAAVRWLGAVVLVVAGMYQFSALKRRCLSECVAPMTWFLRHWRDGNGGAVRMGLLHGATCLGCCWALMLLGFVGGLASVGLMVVAAALMVVEKLPSVAARLTIPLGVALVVAGVLWLVLSPTSAHSHPNSSLQERTTNGTVVARG
jgi:predicted metal-binding membrane protein